MSEDAAESPKVPRRGVFIVWLIIFLDLLGFGIVLPSLAYFVDVFAIPEWALQAAAPFGLHTPEAVFVGLMQTTYSLFQFACAPFWGRTSDRVGRRPVLLISLSGFVVGWLVFSFAQSLVWLLVARMLAGAFGANISTAQAYMADVYPKGERAKGMGLIGMAFGLGFVFGPALGALLASDWTLSFFWTANTPEFARGRIMVPGLFSAGLSALAVLVGIFRLKESLPPEKRQLKRSGSRLAEMASALRMPGLGAILTVYGLVVFGFAALESMFSQFNLHHLKLSHGTNSIVFTAIGLTLAIVQGGMIRPMTERMGSHRVLQIGLIGLAGFMVLFGYQQSVGLGSPLLRLIVLSVLVGGFFSLANPSVLALISGVAKEQAIGETMGITSSVATLGRTLGPLFAGFVYARSGPEAPFVIGGVLVGLAVLLLGKDRALREKPSQRMS